MAALAISAEPLIAALLTQVVIPEIASVIRAHHNATGNMPTDAQVIAALGVDANSGISIGQAWLAAHQTTGVGVGAGIGVGAGVVAVAVPAPISAPTPASAPTPTPIVVSVPAPGAAPKS